MKKSRFSRALQFVSFLFILMILPVMLIVVRQQQDNRQHAANGVQLYAVASTQSVQAGQTISYDIEIDTQIYIVDTLQLNLTYPADKMTITSVTDTDSAFSQLNEQIASNGLIHINRQSPTPVSGKKKVVTLLFTAKQPVQYTALQPGAGLQALSNHQSLTTGTIVTDKNILPAAPQNVPFTFSTFFSVILRLFGKSQ